MNQSMSYKIDNYDFQRIMALVKDAGPRLLLQTGRRIEGR
jgi:hypothetical protein